MLIGISGKAGSGKDTVAAIIKALLHGEGQKVKRFSMADPLKRGCAELFGIDINDFYDRDKKEEVNKYWGKSPRELLIFVGTDLLRDQFDERVWVKRASLEINKLIERGYVVIIPDIRFDNEVDFVEEFGGVMINVIRPNGSDVKEIKHKSEAGVKRTDKTIDILNDSDLDSLQQKIKNIISML